MNLGTLIRHHRLKQGLTLRVVAEKAGVSEGFLSQVENNVKSPSIESLMKICDAIPVTISEILERYKNQQRLFTIKRSEWDQVEIPHSGFATQRFCPPEGRSVIDTALLIIQPEQTIPARKNIKNSQELLCVLRGKVELVYGDEVHELLEGDAVHLWTDRQRQQVTNPGPDKAVVLWVGTL